VRGLNSNAGLASQLTSYQAMLGNWRYLATYDAEIAKITPADVMQTVAQYLTADNRTVATLATAAPSESPGAPANSSPAEKAQ
jgi:predicted Zn-dependent peptidase